MRDETGLRNGSATTLRASLSPRLGLADPSAQDPAQQAAVQQWLRRVPDDPGGLLRNKFLLEQQRRQAKRQGDSDG